MKAAAESLVACEKSCREMVAHMGKHDHAAGAACDEGCCSEAEQKKA